MTSSTPAVNPAPISRDEFQARRERVMQALEGSVGLVFAGEQKGEDFACDPCFAYLTGITSEPGAALLLDPKGENPDRRCVLFLKSRDPELEAWDGYRDPINAALKERHGFTTVMRLPSLPMLFTNAARLRKRVSCLMPLGKFGGSASPDLAAFRKMGEVIPGLAIDDKTNVLASMRAIKSEAELGLMKAAMHATHLGHAAAARAMRPGTTEAHVQRVLTRAFEDAGADGHAYGPIVGTGANSCVLHYRANNAPILANQVLCLDAGAKVKGYCADVTRTFPVSGKFTDRQRDVYNLVLEAMEASIAAVKPGVFMHEVNAATLAVFKKANMLDSYLHGIGHQLGLETHDITPDGPLQPGMVITVEPGLYLAAEAIGVRIEDDILVTQNGYENLTRDIPKTAKDVEQMVG